MITALYEVMGTLLTIWQFILKFALNLICMPWADTDAFNYGPYSFEKAKTVIILYHGLRWQSYQES